ncbi:MAG: GspH/FimT family pseudopilin [Pseudomonadota bacterium]
MKRKTRLSSQAGMTLVEVMAVLFIIGLTAGLVTLTLPERPTEEQASAQAFARVLREAQDQAIMAGQPVGLQLTEQGYGLVQWRQDLWRPQRGAVVLPRGMDISLQGEPRPAPLGWPTLIFDPTGIVQPMQFQLRGRGVRIDISLEETGEVRLVER